MRKVFKEEPDQIAQYKGHFKNGFRHGPGEQIYPGGVKVTGTWSNDKVFGTTKLNLPDGRVVTKAYITADDAMLAADITAAIKESAFQQKEDLSSASFDKRKA